MASFGIAAFFGFALGFLFGVGCAAAVMYTIFLSGYRAALRDAAAGGTGERLPESDGPFAKKMKRR